jgi:hypothetical protein
MKKIRNLILLATLLVQATPSLAQIPPGGLPVFWGGTLDQLPNIVAGNFEAVVSTLGNYQPAGPGLYMSFDYATAALNAEKLAAANFQAGLTGPATQMYVLRAVLNDGATVGNYFVMTGQATSNLAMGEIGQDVASAAVQNGLRVFNASEIIGSPSNMQGYLVVRNSAGQYLGLANAAEDLSLIPTNSAIAQFEQQATNLLSSAQNVLVVQGDQLSPGTVQQLANAGIKAAQNCGWWCGISAGLAGTWLNLKIGLQMYAEPLTTGGMGGVTSAAGLAAGVAICDANTDSLCTNNINISVNYLLYGSAPTSGPTLTAETINPFTMVIERDFSDGSTYWTRSSGIASGVLSSGVGWVQDPETGNIGDAVPLDGADARSSQIMQVNFPDGNTKYLTQAGFSDTLEDAQAAVAATTALNSLAYKFPALFQIPAVVPVLDTSGKPNPAPPPDQSGTSTTTGKTPDGAQYTTTVQKDSGGNVVAENTTIYGQNYTTSKNDLTGTSLTIQRNPDGSTSIFNCIGKGAVCATDSGIVNFDDGWGGKNPYDASNQTFSLFMPGGGGGGGPNSLVPSNSVVGVGGCDALGC